jgi:3-oxoacyl-[acyl-carrier protein] reductase
VDLGLRNTRCLVTGSTGGIGLAVARLLADEGAHVVTTGRGDAPMVGEALHVRADLAQSGEPERLVSEAGDVDVLVNNVGIAHQRSFEEVTDAQWDELWQLNVMSYIRAIRAVLPGMKERGGGVIVNVSSTAAFSTRGSSIPYNIAKTGVVQMTRTLAQALAPTVRVNCVAPGTVPTRWWENGPPGALDRAIANSKFQRLTAAEDVADATLLLVENDSLSGQTLAVDLASVMH